MLHTRSARAWELARRQHGVIARSQLLDLGFSVQAVKERISRGRLHPIHRGVYAVGRPELSREGRWTAAVLTCGRGAVLSHESAAALWGLRPERGLLEVSVPRHRWVRRPPVVVHRRGPIDTTTRRGVPVTTVACTIADLAGRLVAGAVEAMIREADKLDLIDPEALRAEAAEMGPRPGAAALRGILDRRTFTLTDSDLERRFLRLVRQAGLPKPLTGQRLNGFRVDFYWPELGLIVETDGLRYHRTPAQQAHDRFRDHAHLAAGLTTLRFTHAQVAFEPGHVVATLAAVARRLAD
jgi:very-short-patch-repair endonuclease